jgi:hypothetical protein
LASKLSGPDLSGASLTRLVSPVPDLSGIQQFCFKNLVIFKILATSCRLLIINSCLSLSYLRMDPCHEKRTKKWQDVAGTSSKRGRSGKALAGCFPHPSHHPSHSSESEQDERELYERFAPEERQDHYALCYSKKTKQSTINENREAPVYEGSKQSRDPRFWSLFHSDWYRSIYLNKGEPMVETQWVNWDSMANKRHTIFNEIKATCDELEMTKMMSFKYDWNKEIICQFYDTLYFDADAQKLVWMSVGQKYDITIRGFACLLELEH